MLPPPPPRATMALSNHREPVEQLLQPMFWRARETRIQWRKGTPQFRHRILSITTDMMLHSREFDKNVLGVCVVCANQPQVAGAWTDGLVQPRRPCRPGAVPVIVQRGEGCIRGSVGGCLAEPLPPLPRVVPFVGVPKWTGASPSLRNHLA